MPASRRRSFQTAERSRFQDVHQEIGRGGFSAQRAQRDCRLLDREDRGLPSGADVTATTGRGEGGSR